MNGYDVDRILRWAIEVDFNVRRQRFWLAEYLLHRMRQTFIDIFAYSRNHPRALHAFDSHVDEKLKAHLSTTFPQNNLASMHEVLFRMLDILEDEIVALSSGQLHLTLTASQREVIAKIRARESWL